MSPRHPCHCLAEVRAAQSDFVQLLTQGEISAVTAQHFGFDDAARREHMAMLRGMVVELASAVYWRVDAVITRYPYRLLLMVHPDRSSDERAMAAEELYQAHECCLDADCSLRLRSLFTCGAELRQSEPAMTLLRSWSDHGRVSVGHIERSHATNRHSFNASRTARRSAEGATYSSFLREHMVWHTKRGRLDHSLPRHDAAYVEQARDA